MAMLNDETKRKLRLMNIGEFISVVDLQEDDPQLLALPFSERFQMAVDHVYQDKYNLKSERLIGRRSSAFRRQTSTTSITERSVGSTGI